MPTLATPGHPPHSNLVTDLLADRRPRLAVLVSDREWPARALESALVEEGYATLRAGSADQAVALCAAADPDVVFIEHRLALPPSTTPGHTPAEPGGGGLALVRRLRREGAVSEAAPLVVTTVDAPCRSDVLDALGSGAWEVWALPNDPAAMLARCGAWIRAKRHAARTAESGLADPETGLYNLRGLLRRARELAGAARRGEGNPVLACVALHAGGVGAPSAAALVRQVSAACGGVGRVTDVFARTGTREFAILAPATSAAGAERLLERLRGALGGVAVDAVVRTADCGSGDPGEAVELVIRTLEALAARG